MPEIAAARRVLRGLSVNYSSQQPHPTKKAQLTTVLETFHGGQVIPAGHACLADPFTIKKSVEMMEATPKAAAVKPPTPRPIPAKAEGSSGG